MMNAMIFKKMVLLFSNELGLSVLLLSELFYTDLGILLLNILVEDNVVG